MQDRYVGDVGDFAKYSLLNSLACGRSLGVVWYLYPNETHNSDGKHTSHLTKHVEHRDIDPAVFDGLRNLVGRGDRTVAAIQKSGLLHASKYFDEELVCDHSDYKQRREWRRSWFRRAAATVALSDIVFADPDNGLRLDSKYKWGTRKHWKSIPVEEVQELALGCARSVVVYHHNTRFVGGHHKEIRFWIEELKAAFAIQIRAGSNRAFFVLNADASMMNNAISWVAKFGSRSLLFSG